MPTTDPAPHTNEFTVLIDHRERIGGYRFQGFTTDSDRGYRPLIIPTREVTLKTGDYTIDGFADRITVERKSKADLYHTLGQERERFEREHERMAAMEFAAVVIEAELSSAIACPPSTSRLHPRAVVRTWLSWLERYGVPWLWVGGARGAEKITFYILQTFWRHQQE